MHQTQHHLCRLLPCPGKIEYLVANHNNRDRAVEAAPELEVLIVTIPAAETRAVVAENVHATLVPLGDSQPSH